MDRSNSHIAYDIAALLRECDSPQRFADVVSTAMLYAASDCRESAEECSSNWQDKNVGKPWDKLAAKLERYAASVTKGIE